MAGEGVGGYAWDKIPQQDFVLKIQGGGVLCARVGVFAGHYALLI